MNIRYKYSQEGNSTLDKCCQVICEGFLFWYAYFHDVIFVPYFFLHMGLL